MWCCKKNKKLMVCIPAVDLLFTYKFLSLMMQWIDGALSRGEKVEFFHDEFRCPVYVMDVVTIILALINKWNSSMEVCALN